MPSHKKRGKKEISLHFSRICSILGCFSSFRSLSFSQFPSQIRTTTISTGVKWSTLNPVWDAKWQLLNVTDGTVLEMFVKDKNKMMVDTDLGRASLLLSNIEGTHEHVVDIWKSNTKKQGQILVKVCIALFIFAHLKKRDRKGERGKMRLPHLKLALPR